MPVIDYFLRERPEKIIETLSDFLSIDEPLAVAVGCYPNPFTDEIRIGVEAEGFGAEEVALYDLLGRKVFVQPCCLNSGHNEIVLRPNVKSGVYLLKLGNLTKKVIKQ